MVFSSVIALLLACGLALAYRDRSRALGAEESPVLVNDYVAAFEIVTSFPHDADAFTQGLAFDAGGKLYESDGLYRKSAVRSVDVMTGHSERRVANAANHFGEGIAIVGNRMLQLTWQEKVVNEFSLPDLQLRHSHDLPCAKGTDTQPTRCNEGWGLAYDGKRLYLTDSTDKLFFLNPSTFESVAPPVQIYDHRMKRPVHGVNELEWVDGELWGNVFPMYQGEASECIVRINATDASVIGWIDLRGLQAMQREAVRRTPHNYVLNGIAYHPSSKRLYVTGKQWDKMYHVRVKAAEHDMQKPQWVESNCHLGRADGKRFG